MVAGIDSFKDKFRGFEDCYTVIGGAAWITDIYGGCFRNPSFKILIRIIRR
ncbi:hypothetical protein [Butyrivibrio sp.]|uniref:hypothetical protein n=1 Tax=Butyrivibrio sp. TaxID=28121 RepID=UPI0025C56FA3|nr:hypothetical protein [Butyrivibrio sp.]MBQ9302763.1 hypothetical protein [Butyrivibrio sp.]